VTAQYTNPISSPLVITKPVVIEGKKVTIQ